MTYSTLNEAVILSNSYKASQLYKKAGNMLQPYQSQGFYNSSLRLYMGWDDDMEKIDYEANNFNAHCSSCNDIVWNNKTTL